ncbi:MAG TPA: DinB family protein [Chitinophagaceae bacterium]|nr:DinB family protein [Chitinophagaceae bacterium]
MSPVIQPIAKQFALHTRLFNNVLEGVADEKGNQRLNQQVNHLQWIAGHLTNARYNQAPMLGLTAVFPYKDLYTDASKPPPNNRAIDESIAYPSLAEILGYWNSFAAPFTEAVANMGEEQLAGKLPFGIPIGDNTILGLMAFLASHESSHIGQMSIIRKYIGLDAMSYK